MSSIRSRGNATTEERFAELLRTQHITGWRRHLPLPGKPDFTFCSARVVVFIDGCFWHGCPRCYRRPGDNKSYWTTKLVLNRRRDRRNANHLRARGWHVLRIWEHTLKSPSGRCSAVNRVTLMLSRLAHNAPLPRR